MRWGAPFARVDGAVRTEPAPSEAAAGVMADWSQARGVPDTKIEVVLLREGPGGGRKRIRVNGVARRTSSLAGILRIVLFAPEDMLLIAGSPTLRRGALDLLAGQRAPSYLHDLTAYSRTLQQRNGLLRAIREEQAGRDELRFWDAAFLDSGAALLAGRARLLEAIAEPLAAAHAEIAPDEAAAGRLTLRYVTNAPALPGEGPRDALERRLRETAEKEVWNGTTLVGPHRDDLAFEMGGRDLATFASRGQQRTAILAFKLAELDLLAELDGRPPLLLLDDVFSELDPERRSHLVRRIAALPQAFLTTTTLEDLDPRLRAHATAWEVVPDPRSGAGLVRDGSGPPGVPGRVDGASGATGTPAAAR